MRRTATATQRQKKFSYEQANPLLPTNRSKQKQRAFDAATEYFKSYNTPLTTTLRDIFGVEFFARAALWLDPLAPFRNSAGIIGYENRFREIVGFKHTGTVYESTRFVGTDNRLDDHPEPVSRYVYEDSTLDQPPIVNNNATDAYSYMWDSTDSSRAWSDSYGSGEFYDRAVPSFGTMFFHNYKSEDYLTPNLIFRRDRTESHYSRDNYDFYDDSEFHTTLSIDGSCTSPLSGSIFLDNLDAFVLQFMNDNLSSVLSGALASKRSFNLAYQVAELQDLPRMLSDIGNLRLLIESYLKKPFQKLADLDKDVASLYLSAKFGWESLADAHKGLMKLPEKATKRLNYLIKRSGKVTTGRSSRTWSRYEFDQELPTFEFLLPDWIVVQNETVERQVSIELRCVVNQTIQFPTLAVPKLTDIDYLKVIGAVPRVEDLYNILPFTWLFDWFGGLGAYIDVMDAVHSDRQLINYGFLTIVLTEVLTHTAELKVTSTYTRTRPGLNPGDPTVIEEFTETEKVIPYLKTYTHKHQRRVDLGSLEGVKSFGFFQTNLSDFQTKILGSLTSQRL